MELPGYVAQCLERLERGGFAAWAVGGCVRDACLGLTPHDYDLCTAALPEQTEAVFSGCGLVLAGKKHGTVGVITEGGVVEITTFRTEGDYRDNRHPEWVRFVPEVEQDLARRDFTVNAMAWSPTRGFADPFGGRRDLEAGILRAVGDPDARFHEDSLRILRGVRFAARYGLEPEPETAAAMVRCAHLMDSLARERVFTELCGILTAASARELLTFAPVLARAIPELAPLVGYDQGTRYHAHDLYTHTALVTEGVPPEPVLRWAALLHDIDKIGTRTEDEAGQAHYFGHASRCADMADGILRRLKAPTALRERAVLLIRQHMTPLEPDRRLLRRRLNQMGPEAVGQLLQLQRADRLGTGRKTREEEAWGEDIAALLEQLAQERACLTVRDLAVNGHDLMDLGYRGPDIGKCLAGLLEQVLEEKTENTKEALLALARREE